jgi:hypothetical protein
VYYPTCSEEFRENIRKDDRNAAWLRHGDKTLLGIAKAGGGHAYGGKGKHVSLKVMRSLRKIKTDTLIDGQVHPDFTRK